jgi:sulfate permease, SulP family
LILGRLHLTSAPGHIDPSTDKFTPKLVSSLREGYGAERFRRDLVAGLTVAIVALPLSMAIAIASHAKPEAGLFAAIVGGVLISALGGSRFQIGGPAGAFIVIIASIIDVHGFDGLMLATLMAGVILVGLGALGLGRFIRYVPHAVTVGFTAGIAVIIAASQIKDFLGLKLGAPEPAGFLPKLAALWRAGDSINLWTCAVATSSVLLIIAIRRCRPQWPAFLIAVGIASVVSLALHLGVETIASRFGELPRTLPWPRLPEMSWLRVFELLPSALALAVLGGIESLLSAVVADGMSGRRHRSNMELIAQGAANIGCSLVGGITATGTIARTATNIRAGAATPLSGIFHALFIALFLAVAAPLAGFIPLAALAAILIVVAWTMAEKDKIWRLFVECRGEALVMAVTFLLVVLYDLPTAIAAGTVLGLALPRLRQRVRR